MLFRLTGRSDPVFRVVNKWDDYRGIPGLVAVKGITIDGRYQTVARIDDVEIIPDVEIAP